MVGFGDPVLMANIVPFGKYKGHSVEMLAADTSYCEWLMAQPWFAEKFRDVYNVVVNYGGPPQDTPEHNALQARFLDDDFCLKVARLVFPEHFDLEPKIENGVAAAKAYRQELIERAEKKLADEGDASSLPIGLDSSWKARRVEMAMADVESAKNTECFLERHELCIKKTAFEVGGWDVVFLPSGGYIISIDSPKGCEHSSSYMLSSEIGNVYVEAKPVVGDDYPTVLRQITGYKRDGRAVLLIDQFDARGATLEQVRKIFSSRGISIVMLSDVENA